MTLDLQTDLLPPDAPPGSLERMVRASGPCLSCGAPAVLSNEDGAYCKDCMQIHLVEKMFVNLTKMQRPQ